MKTIKILTGPDKGKKAKLVSKDRSEATIIVEGETETKKIPIEWIKILGFISDLLRLIISVFKK